MFVLKGFPSAVSSNKLVELKHQHSEEFVRDFVKRILNSQRSGLLRWVMYTRTLAKEGKPLMDNTEMWRDITRDQIADAVKTLKMAKEYRFRTKLIEDCIEELVCFVLRLDRIAEWKKLRQRRS